MHRYRSHTCADLRPENVGEAVRLLRQALPVPPIALPAAGAAIVVLTVIALIQAFVDGSGVEGISAGPGFGLWLALPLSVALAYFLALDAQKKGATLPIRLPGASA